MKSMKEILKKWKVDIISSAVLCIVLGIVLIVWSKETINIICRLLSVGLMIMGGVNIFGYFMDRIRHPFSGALGLIMLLVGIWIFVNPGRIVSMIPIVIGVILVIHGIQDIKYSMDAKESQNDKWWAILLMAVISLVLGVICIVYAFGVVKLAMIFIGISLIYDGLSDLAIVFLTTKAVRYIEQEEGAIDIEYKEIK